MTTNPALIIKADRYIREDRIEILVRTPNSITTTATPAPAPHNTPAATSTPPKP